MYDRFVSHIANRECLEIGCGPYGYLPTRDWIQHRTVIDPLVDVYRAEELKLLGKTFFTDDVKTFARQAEDSIQGLSFDGCIVCQNTLDHCEDPLAVVAKIGRYAAPGCFLLLWTDIFHLAHIDRGHRNITKSEAAMDSLLAGLGFEVLKNARKIRNPEEFIEYGRLAIKVHPILNT